MTRKTPQRTKRARQHFEEIGLKDKHGNAPVLIEANTGFGIDHVVDNSIKRAKRLQRTSLSEIGCFSSHRSIWKRIIAKQIQTALILEDDAVFDVEKVNHFIENFDQVPDYDFLSLGWIYCKNPKPQNIARDKQEVFPNLWQGDGMWLTHSYCLSLQGSEFFERKTRIQYGGLDWQLSGLQTEMEKSFGFNPGIVNQLPRSANNRSTIHHTQ